jgi:hypothetical protein
MPNPIIPRFEPEVVDREAWKHWRGDHEKVRTTSLKSLKVRGVELTSRYGKAEEFETMAAVLSLMPYYVVEGIKSVFCNSKTGSNYSIEPRYPLTPEAAQRLGEAFARACLATVGGYNFISVSGIAWLDPEWGGG